MIPLAMHLQYPVTVQLLVQLVKHFPVGRIQVTHISLKQQQIKWQQQGYENNRS